MGSFCFTINEMGHETIYEFHVDELPDVEVVAKMWDTTFEVIMPQLSYEATHFLLEFSPEGGFVFLLPLKDANFTVDYPKHYALLISKHLDESAFQIEDNFMANPEEFDKAYNALYMQYVNLFAAAYKLENSKSITLMAKDVQGDVPFFEIQL